MMLSLPAYLLLSCTEPMKWGMHRCKSNFVNLSIEDNGKKRHCKIPSYAKDKTALIEVKECTQVE